MIREHITTMDKSKNKFKIGEFSKLNRISVKTLRHYDEIGLLRPNEVDEWTGYRYYDVSQFVRLSIILKLKQLRFSLDEIKNMFDDGLELPTAEMIRAKIDECRAEQDRLARQYAELIGLENDIHGGKTMEEIFMKTLPAVTVASYRKKIRSYDELFTLCPNVIGKEMKRLGCTCNSIEYGFTMEHDPEYRSEDIDIEYCEAVDAPFAESDSLKCKRIDEVKTAICINHRGSYNNFQESMARLLQYIEQHQLTITQLPRYCYIDGIWNKDDERDWLTRIEVPIAAE